MRHSRIYVDTSVLGGCFDREFAQWSNALVEDFRQARLHPVLSDLLAAEVKDAPQHVRDLHGELRALAGLGIQLSTEAKFRNDMLHRTGNHREGRCRRELELPAHCSLRQDSAIQRSELGGWFHAAGDSFTSGDRFR